MTVLAAVVAYILVGLGVYCFRLAYLYKKCLKDWDRYESGLSRPTIPGVAQDNFDDIFVALCWPLYFIVTGIFWALAMFATAGVLIVETILNWNYKSKD